MDHGGDERLLMQLFLSTHSFACPRDPEYTLAASSSSKTMFLHPVYKKVVRYLKGSRSPNRPSPGLEDRSLDSLHLKNIKIIFTTPLLSKNK